MRVLKMGFALAFVFAAAAVAAHQPSLPYTVPYYGTGKPLEMQASPQWTAGMRVYRDPVTGKLEHRSLPSKMQMPARDNSLMTIERYPSGMIKLNLNGQRDAILNVHRDASGRFSYQCGADALLPQLPASAVDVRKGESHEH